MDRVDQVTKDCFNALIQIRALDPSAQPPPEVLHQRLRSFVDAMSARGREAGFSQEDVRDMAYAIVALADEIVLSSSGPARQFWMSRPLQLHYFNENTAGDGFFDRVEALRQDPSRADVLRVYYLCLMLGFYGRYRLRGGEAELLSITEAVAQDLARARQFGGETLSPHGERPAEARGASRRELPLLWLAGGAVVLSLALYVGLRVAIGGEADRTGQRIEQLNRRP